MQKTHVIIVGGSLVGLSASVFLSHRAIPNIVIEKHTSSSPHPRAMGFTTHTMEFYRAVGLGDKIPQIQPGFLLRRAKVRSLFGEWLGESEWTPGAKPSAIPLSPCMGAAIAQDKLEPILRERAQAFGSHFKLGYHCESVRESEGGVEVVIRNRETGDAETLYGQYLIAADGAGSQIRQSLGIERTGVGHLRTINSVLFHCPEADVMLS